jgi:hypothetical protein
VAAGHVIGRLLDLSHIGLAHARKTAQITVEADNCQITVEPGITITAARTTSRDIRRHNASSYLPG